MIYPESLAAVEHDRYSLAYLMFHYTSDHSQKDFIISLIKKMALLTCVRSQKKKKDIAQTESST